MKLQDVAHRFDLTPVWDAYDGRKLAARCQVTAWDSPRRDGLTTIRRTLTTAYGVRFPARNAVVIGGEVWLLARDPSHDSFGHDVIRVGYIAQQAHLGRVADTEQLIADDGVEVYLSRVWLKDVKDITTTSEAQSQYYIYFTSGEPVVPGSFLYLDDTWHLCRNVIAGTAGLMIAECNELKPDCKVTVDVAQAGEWDPVTETYTPGALVQLRGIVTKWRDDYDHELPSADKEQVGDVRIRFRAADAVMLTTATRISYKGDVWQMSGASGRADGSVSTVWRRVA